MSEHDPLPELRPARLVLAWHRQRRVASEDGAH